jgi:Family of unknown function (DUF6491)
VKTSRMPYLAAALSLAALAACASTGASAGASDVARVDAPSGEAAYVVVEPNARIFPASMINGFGVVDSDTLLLNVGANRLYLADVWPSCGRNLRFDQHIGIEHRGADQVDNFSWAIIDGRRCPISNLRRVERKPAEAAQAPADAPASPAHGS